jgi:uncharacterized membrane protein YkoI
MKRVPVGLLAAVVAALAGLPAYAQRPASAAAHGGPLAPVRLSMAQAVQMVEQRFRARVVRAETTEQDGRTVYVLRVLDRSGRVFTVRVDAASGQIL